MARELQLAPRMSQSSAGASLGPRQTDPERAVQTPFGRALKLGTWWGLQLALDFSLLLVFGLVLFNLAAGVLPDWHPDWPSSLRWGVATGAALLFFLSILLHELAHALVGRALGIPVSGITLFMFGGMAHLEREPERPSAEFWMAMAGPLTSLLIGVGATLLGGWLGMRDAASLAEDPLAVMRSMGPLATLLLWLGPINVVLALFNLLPGFPLDGGRVLRAALWWMTGDLRRATRHATAAGVLISWLLIASGLLMAFGFHVPLLGRGLGSGLWLMLIGWFLNTAARASYAQLVARQALAGVAVADLMWTQPLVVSPVESVHDVVREKVLHTDQRLFPVVAEGELVGVVSVNHLRRLPDDEWSGTPIRSIMTPGSELKTVTPSSDATQALKLLDSEATDELPVVERGHLRGLLRRQDLLRWLSLHAGPTPRRV